MGCWGCPRGALGEGERGPLMVAPPGRRASEGEAGGTILCLLSHQGLLQGDAAAKSFQSCLTLCDPIDGLLPGSPGILQERTLEWAAISFSNARKWKEKLLSRVQLLATPWTAAYQAPPSMGFSRQEYWSGVPSPSPLQGDRPPRFQLCVGDLHPQLQLWSGRDTGWLVH